MNQEIQSNIAQIPLHRKIAENLTGQVKSGKLKPGEKLPSERQIARQFRASRATVRTALQHLEQSGLITRRERRSALVAVRRDITPYLRIACSSHRLVQLMERLDEMQLLPPRCQVQQFDLQRPEAVSRLISRSSMLADVLICEWEFLNAFQKNKAYHSGITRTELSDIHFMPLLNELFVRDKQFTAVPLGISPMILYIRQSRLREAAMDFDPLRWNWDQFQQITSYLSGMGRYGFQFRPVLPHLAALLQSRGGELFRQDGRIDTSSPLFDPTLRWIHQMIHIDKIVPILAKTDQIDLFADQRCATALGGFEHYPAYHQLLGDDLRLGFLPRRSDMPGLLTGFAAVIMPGLDNAQPAIDLMRKLLSGNTQRLMIRHGGAMPVRNELLNADILMAENIPSSHANILLGEIPRCRPMVPPDDLDQKIAVENLLLELWLGLAPIDDLRQRFKQL